MKNTTLYQTVSERPVTDWRETRETVRREPLGTRIVQMPTLNLELKPDRSPPADEGRCDCAERHPEWYIG